GDAPGVREVPVLREAPAVGDALTPVPAKPAVAVPVERGEEAGAPWHAATRQASTATTATTGCPLVIRPGIIRSRTPPRAGRRDLRRAPAGCGGRGRISLRRRPGCA